MKTLKIVVETTYEFYFPVGILYHADRMTPSACMTIQNLIESG